MRNKGCIERGIEGDQLDESIKQSPQGWSVKALQKYHKIERKTSPIKTFGTKSAELSL